MSSVLKVTQIGRSVSGSMYLKVGSLVRTACTASAYFNATPLSLLTCWMNFWNSDLPQIKSGNNQHAEHAYRAELDTVNQRIDIWKISSGGSKQRICWTVYVL